MNPGYDILLKEFHQTVPMHCRLPPSLAIDMSQPRRDSVLLEHQYDRIVKLDIQSHIATEERQVHALAGEW